MAGEEEERVFALAEQTFFYFFKQDKIRWDRKTHMHLLKESLPRAKISGFVFNDSFLLMELGLLEG